MSGMFNDNNNNNNDDDDDDDDDDNNKLRVAGNLVYFHLVI